MSRCTRIKVEEADRNAKALFVELTSFLTLESHKAGTGSFDLDLDLAEPLTETASKERSSKAS
jgi:hypothetical protein